MNGQVARKNRVAAERVAHYTTYPSNEAKEVPCGLETTYKAGQLYASLQVQTKKYGINAIRIFSYLGHRVILRVIVFFLASSCLGSRELMKLEKEAKGIHH